MSSPSSPYPDRARMLHHLKRIKRENDILREKNEHLHKENKYLHNLFRFREKKECCGICRCLGEMWRLFVELLFQDNSHK